MNNKKNLCSLLAITLATVLCIVFTACSGDHDDGLEKTDIISENDPEGTIVINMRNGKSANWYDIGITSIHINEANNFSGAEFLSVGKVSGLSKVNNIPSIGWTETIAVVPETGYVVRSKGKYARLYVVDYIVSTEGGIIGATVKYQSPFELPIELDQTTLVFSSDGGSQTISLKNQTNYKIDTENLPSWCKVSNYNKGSIVVSVTQHFSAQQFSAEFTLSNSIGSVTVNIIQEPSPNPLFEGGRDYLYQIKTAQQLSNVRKLLKTNSFICFELIADIDLTTYLDPNGNGWEPIGSENAPFTNYFNGNGHTIKGFWAKRPSSDYVGLFGVISSTQIWGLKVETDGNGIEGKDYVGGICGKLTNDSEIRDCSFSGIIKGNNYVSGICGGGMNSIVYWCYSEGKINADGLLSGICLFTEIQDCYSTAVLESKSGLAYAIGTDWVTRCYFAGTCNTKASGDISFIRGDYTYYDSDLTGVDPETEKYARTTVQLMTKSNYETWDFDTVWEIQEGKSYPTLRPHDYSNYWNNGNDTTLNDYYFQYEVVDRGTLSDADANALMGTLNSLTGTMTAYTKAEAIYVFDSVVEDLRTSFAGVNEFELSFRVKLKTKAMTVKSKVINIKTIGCTVE